MTLNLLLAGVLVLAATFGYLAFARSGGQGETPAVAATGTTAGHGHENMTGVEGMGGMEGHGGHASAAASEAAAAGGHGGSTTHDAGAAPTSRPRFAVLGTFAVANLAVLLAAAYLRWYSRPRRQRPAAAPARIV